MRTNWMRRLTQSKQLLRWLKWLVVLAVLTTGVGYGWYVGQPAGGMRVEYETEDVSLGELTYAVTASGQLNPVVRVEVGSQISGIIQKLFADFNSNVKEGQLVAQIDPAAYEAAFVQAEGNLASTKAALELARLNERRTQELLKNNLVAQSEYDSAIANLHQAEAAVKISEGARRKAQVDLSRCTIHSPIDGIVISRDVNVGQTVAASLSAPKLFVIANDLAKMQIEAKVSEADIGRVAVGQNVKFNVDAFPGNTFAGQVVQVRNSPTNDQNVVTYETIIEVNNPELKLKPGMTANVTIVVAQRDGVLKIPNAALRFRPPKDVEVKKIEPAEASSESAKKLDDTTTDKNSSSESAKKPDDSTGKNTSVASANRSDDTTAKKVKKDKKSKRKGEQTIYLLRDGALCSTQVKLGITDGRESEVTEGLKEGDVVVVDMSEPEESPTLMSRLLAAIRKKED